MCGAVHVFAFRSVTSQLLGHVTSSNAPLTHVTLLLIIDQRRALDSLQVRFCTLVSMLAM